MSSDVILELIDFSKNYGKVEAVKRLSLEIRKGEIYGFLGPNGAGKTTTIRAMTGLVRPTSGVVRIKGYNVHTHFLRAIQCVGTLMENPAFYPYLSGWKNLEILARLTSANSINPLSQIDELLGMVKLSDAARNPVRTYSQGMRQRLGIAASLLGKPEIVILDEPTNGLDPLGINEMRELIREIATERGITVFLSSHLLKEVEQVCSKVAIINKGRLVVEGEVESLLKADRQVTTLEQYFLKYTSRER